MERFLARRRLGGVSYLGVEMISIIIRRIETHVCETMWQVAAEAAEQIVWAGLGLTLFDFEIDKPIVWDGSRAQVPRGRLSGECHCPTRWAWHRIKRLDPPRARRSLQHHTNVTAVTTRRGVCFASFRRSKSPKCKCLSEQTLHSETDSLEHQPR